MTEISTPHQRRLLAQLNQRIQDSQQRQQRIEAEFTRRRQELLDRQESEFQAACTTHQSEFDSLQGEYLSRLETARGCFDATRQRLDKFRNDRTQAAEQLYHRAVGEGEMNWSQTRAIALQDHESDQQSAKEAVDKARIAVEDCRQHFQWIERRAEALLKRRGMSPKHVPPPPSDPDIGTAQLVTRFAQEAQELQDRTRSVSSATGVRFADEGWSVLVFIASFAALALFLGISYDWSGWMWWAMAATVALIVATLLRGITEVAIRSRHRDSLTNLAQRLQTARDTLEHAEQMVPIEERRRQRDAEKRKNRRLRQADETWNTIAADLKSEWETETSQAESVFQQGLKLAQQTWDQEVAATRESCVPRIEASEAEYARELAERHRRYSEELQSLETDRSQQWSELTAAHQAGLQEFADEIRIMRRFCEETFPNLDAIDWQPWRPPTADLPALRFGEYEVDLSQFGHDVPLDSRLVPDWKSLTVPAVLAFPQAPSLVLETDAQGRTEAIELLQLCMVRMLTSWPPGKVKFTIFDPTGLGENFSTFMHLSDFDERLVTSRIWTETAHIQQRLTDLTEHMENVIQKYLRNEFASIQEYNLRAGEIAEPFQVLVIANFPVNFSEEAARRLLSIASSGARCGVYFMLSVDRRLKLPSNFDLADLEAAANTLEWCDGRFQWKTADLRQFPLHYDRPPAAETATSLVKTVGQHAKNANRVEVPFASVAPDQDAWWQQNSGDQIEVPLGRAGATQLQYLQLGSGTSQHVLIAGKTGSGKSTLLNAIITNLALHYAPDQLEFFLVDFKKGVEFKAYAEYQLPHARVIAIESEREFGLSVLERLDAELHARGERFRAAAAQNLAAFRAARPAEPLPRQLLIVDEFQEFFVKDDKIAQEAGLLLDRLVRQGRAFGIHVLLGSQTLAGAYSLARSTLGQMAIRIALQCSESDAHLILSEENTAARLLNRPGEAIYNNANGRFEGNHPFQVVWLPDAERERYLKQLAIYARTHATSAPPIVFEGNVAANLSDNPELWGATTSAGPTVSASPPKVWLGAAIAIKEPTQITFRRQSGAHLLVVGQQENMAMGLFASALVGLAARPGPLPANGHRGGTGTRCIVLDGGGFEAGGLNLGPRIQRWPLTQVETADANAARDIVLSLGRELRDRMESPALEEPAGPLFLVIYNLARFRDLRRSDDDYGLGSFSDDGDASPGQTLARILREGASFGIHCLIWCDTYNNVTRWFDRQSLRDIGYRVLFQMSAADSSNLMDSPAASQLGNHRAILYDDERGEYERFRPYGVPDDNVVQGLVGCELERDRFHHEESV